MPRYAFGPFSLDPEARVLLREGEAVPMAGKALDTLLLLVQNRGRLVDKDELLSRIWAGSVVEQANLAQSISTVRKILGDNPKDHHYIATVAGRGYQFVAPVTEMKDETPQRTPERIKRHPFWRPHRRVLFGLVVLFFAVTAAAWFAFRRPAGTPAELAEQQLTFNSSGIASVAISPTANTSPTPIQAESMCGYWLQAKSGCFRRPPESQPLHSLMSIPGSPTARNCSFIRSSQADPGVCGPSR